MQITVIGPGSMGRGIATRMLAGGHSVTLAGRSREAAERLASELRSSGSGSVDAADTPAEAIQKSEVVILASPYAGNLELAREHGPALAGKTVVDISNPLNDTYDGLVTPPGISAGETVQAALPAGTKLVKAFNTTFAGTLAEGHAGGQTLDVFLAGDDDESKRRVAELVRSGGMNPVDVGPLAQSRQLEALALLGITIQGRLGTGFKSGWKLLLPR